MRWLVLGKNGMFGSDMSQFLSTQSEEVVSLGHSELDLASTESVIAEALHGFDVVISAVAYTNVNLAEKEREKAFVLNRDLPAKLARITALNRQKLVHISTDYVFDGTKKTPYETTDKPNPINVYGESKLAGEYEVAERNPQALIVRTSWLYGPRGQCFPKTILDKIRAGNVSVVDDQVGTPTSTWFLRQFCFRAVTRNYEGGLYHGVPNGSTSWFGFAKRIASGNEGAIQPVPSVQNHGAARRPVNSQLSPHPATGFSWIECWEEIKSEFLEPDQL